MPDLGGEIELPDEQRVSVEIVCNLSRALGICPPPQRRLDVVRACGCPGHDGVWKMRLKSCAVEPFNDSKGYVQD